MNSCELLFLSFFGGYIEIPASSNGFFQRVLGELGPVATSNVLKLSQLGAHVSGARALQGWTYTIYAEKRVTAGVSVDQR